MRKCGLIGFGAIGKQLYESWDNPGGAELRVILVRERSFEATRSAVGGRLVVTSSIDEFLDQDIDTVLEAAGQSALETYAAQALAADNDVFAISTGSFADSDFCTLVCGKSRTTGRSIYLPSGALAGFDGLLALREEGLQQVFYTSTKPPAAWRGTPAETVFDLESLRTATVIFSGTARDAARQFPQNANLAASVALAGLGLDRTDVTLVADPDAVGNVGLIEAHTATTSLKLSISGRSMLTNPKTSSITALSMLAMLRNERSALRF